MRSATERARLDWLGSSDETSGQKEKTWRRRLSCTSSTCRRSIGWECVIFVINWSAGRCRNENILFLTKFCDTKWYSNPQKVSLKRWIIDRRLTKSRKRSVKCSNTWEFSFHWFMFIVFFMFLACNRKKFFVLVSLFYNFFFFKQWLLLGYTYTLLVSCYLILYVVSSQIL